MRSRPQHHRLCLLFFVYTITMDPLSSSLRFFSYMSVDTELKSKSKMPPKPPKSSWTMPILLAILFITVLSSSIKQIPQKEWLLMKVCKDQGPELLIKNASSIWDTCSQDVSVQVHWQKANQNHRELLLDGMSSLL